MTADALVSAGAGLIGALIGAFAALTASWFQNRHDAKQRERERLMSLRRDVYLEAAEGIAGAPLYLVGFANADVPVESLAPLLNSKPGWQTKLHAVATLDTISAFGDADALFISTAFELIPKRHRVDELARLAAEEHEKRGQLTQFQAALHTALQTHVPQLPEVQAVAAVENIRLDIDRAQGEIVASHEREADFHDERAALIAKLLEFSVSKVAKHRLLVAKAIAAIRRELDNPVDEGAYLALTERMNQQFFSAFDPFAKQLKAGDERPAS
jgi:hypothetical protein